MGNVRSSYSSRRENDVTKMFEFSFFFLIFLSYKQLYFAIHSVAPGIDTFNTASSQTEASRNFISC